MKVSVTVTLTYTGSQDRERAKEKALVHVRSAVEAANYSAGWGAPSKTEVKLSRRSPGRSI